MYEESEGTVSNQVAVESDPAVQIFNEQGVGPFVFVCEHASNRIPDAYQHIGVSYDVQHSHSGWDIGALALSKLLSAKTSSPLVASTVSRLVYDCNRAPDSSTAIVQRSEFEAVPGNVGLSEAHRLQRVTQVYEPFSLALSGMLKRRVAADISTTLVTVHSFTPVFHGNVRTVELGVLHDKDSLLADSMLEIATGYTNLLVQRNQPYGPTDDVTHTLTKHALPLNLLNVMLEIKNDLLLDKSDIERIAGELNQLLIAAREQAHSNRAHNRHGYN